MGTIISSEKKFGRIIRKDKNSIFVAIESDCQSRSSGCKVGCGSCGGESKLKKAIITIQDENKFSIGDNINFLHYTLNENIVAFIVFGIPIGFAFLSVLGWYIYSPEMAESSLSFLSAGISLIAGFLIVRLIDKWFRFKYPSKIILLHPEKVLEKTVYD